MLTKVMDPITSRLEEGTKIEEIAPVPKVFRIATLPEQPGQNAAYIHNRRASAMEPLGPGERRPMKNYGRLTGRDFEILRYLIENRFAAIDTVEARFWNGRANRNHYRTLYRLQRKGLLAPLVGDGGRLMGYRPTRRGLKLLQDKGVGDFKITDLRSTYRTTFDHERILQELRAIFVSSSLVSDFEPEHLVRERLTRKYGYTDHREQGYKIPDAAFQLQTAKGKFRVALELEIAQKSRRRYLNALKRLLLGRDWDVVFFVVAAGPVLMKLKAALEEVKAQDLEVRIATNLSGMYFAHLSDVLSRRDLCTFEGEGKSFSLVSLKNELSFANTKNAQKSRD